MAARMGARIQGNNRAHQQTDGHRLTVPESCIRKQVADFSARQSGIWRRQQPPTKTAPFLLAANLNSIALGLRGSSESAWTNAEPLPTRTVPPNWVRWHTSVTSATAPPPTSSAHHVLRLTYTAHDMAPFARDLGHHGPPFPWDQEDPPPPPSPPRRPLLPPLRPRPRRRRLHPLHLPHHPTPGPSRNSATTAPKTESSPT